MDGGRDLCGGGARNPQVPTLFQVADVDSGEVFWVNAGLVTRIISGSKAGLVLLREPLRNAQLKPVGVSFTCSSW